MKKALFVATKINFLTHFELSDMKLVQSMGYEVHVACFLDNEAKKQILKNNGIIAHHIDFKRNPFNKNNIRAYKQLKKLVLNNKYDVLHCHTPVGGFLSRLATKDITKDIKVIYTAHGFHFFKGNNVIKNIIFYSLEKYASKYSDAIITLNEEDYVAATKFKLKEKGKVYKINGVGLNIGKFSDVKIDKEQQKKALGLTKEDFMILSVGELSKRKNHIVIIKALSLLKNPNIHYYIAGEGNLKEFLKARAIDMGIGNQFHLLGSRSDINVLLKTADLFCFPSLQEGLSVALMEAVASGIPIIASNIRGNVDIIENNMNGFLIDANGVEDFAEKINKLYEDKQLRNKFAMQNEKIIEKYSISKINDTMKKIYQEILG